MKKQLLLLTIFCVLLSETILVQAQSPIDTLKPGYWMLMPGSMPLWRNPVAGPDLGKSVDDVFGQTGTSAAKQNGMLAWCTAVLDEKRGTYIALNQGGHSSTRDNSSFGFDLLGKTPSAGDSPYAASGGAFAWSRLDDPSPLDQLAIDANTVDFYSDGKPATTHNYGGIQHMIGPNGEVDRYWFSGGNKWPGNGPAFQGTGEFDPKTKTWSQSDAPPPGTAGTASFASAWDEEHMRVLIKFSVFGYLYGYYPLNAPGSRYVLLGSNSINNGFFPGESDRAGTGFYDKKRKRFYVIGGSGGYGVVAYYQFDAAGNLVKPGTGYDVYDAPIDQNAFAVLDDNMSWDFWRSPGGLFDEKGDDIIIYMGGPVKGGGNSSNLIYHINPDTWAISVEQSYNSPSNSCRTGTYNKLRYLAEKDVYVMCVSGYEGIWVYRPLRSGVTTSLSTINEERLQVLQNFPNPFNETTEIIFTTTVACKTQLKIYNILGEGLQEKNLEAVAGNNRITLSANELSPGIYVYSISNAVSTINKQMIIVK